MDNSLAAASKEYQNGEIVFVEYEPGNKFYLIQSGKIELLKQYGLVQKTLDVLHESEMFGEMALLEDTPRTATAVALGKTKLLEFDKNNFQSLILGNPMIAVKLLKTFAKRIYDAKRRFQILTLDDPEARIADVILMLDETSVSDTPSSSERTVVTLRTTPDNMARWAGMGLREATEVIFSFNKKGFLEVFPDKIVVKNINYYSRLVNAARNKSQKK
jgi:CRP-like cAMP-binding protein